MRVTVERLEFKGACNRMVRWFKRRWPKGCETTLKNLTTAAEEATYLLLWFAAEYLGDSKLYMSLNNEEDRLDDIWIETIEKRITERAERAARYFVLYGRSMKMTQSRLREYKKEREHELAVQHKTVAAKLALMVYDKIKTKAKRAPAKRRKPK